MRARLRSGDHVEITTVAMRPELAGNAVDAGPWPTFMRHNRVSEAFFWQSVVEFPEVCLLAIADSGKVLADGHAVRFRSAGELPAGGWEHVVVHAFIDRRRGTEADAVCALNISVDVSVQGQGLAGLMLGALRGAARAAGVSTLVAPVRPTQKSAEPHTAMSEYAARRRPDGLPVDPWLRTHVRVGGEIVGMAPASWVVTGSLSEWRDWTGVPFDRDGLVVVPGALVPVCCDVASDLGVYVEPNVWVRHSL